MTIELEKAETEESDLYEMDRDPNLYTDIKDVSSADFIVEVLDLLGSGRYRLGDT